MYYLIQEILVEAILDVHVRGVRIKLCMMNYCNGVEDFINYVLSNSRNISGGGIRCPCKRCKNKKFLDLDILTMHLLQKRFIEKYLCWFVHGELYIPYEIMLEKIVGSTSNSSNVHGVVDDNNNPYRNMVMSVMKMN
jgi:hypothetical protein